MGDAQENTRTSFCVALIACARMFDKPASSTDCTVAVTTNDGILLALCHAKKLQIKYLLPISQKREAQDTPISFLQTVTPYVPMTHFSGIGFYLNLSLFVFFVVL